MHAEIIKFIARAPKCGTTRPRLILAALALTLVTMDPALAINEVHIISRDSIGDFMESHRLYENQRPNVSKVTYCGRSYFAYPATVQWTQDADSKGYSIALEYSDGTSWEIICQNPQEQVRYKDLTIPKTTAERHYIKRSKGGAWIDVIARKRRTKPSYHSR